MSASDVLPVKIAKRIAGKCLYSGCGELAIDGSDYCEPHDAHERGRAANRQRRYRQKLADGGLCIAGCGRKVSRKRKQDGSVTPRRCSKCRKVHNEDRRDERAKARVTGIDRGVTGAEIAADETDPRWRVDPGTSWQRFRGKGRRGRLTREEQIDEIDRDRRHARENDAALGRALPLLKLPEVMELPVIQRGAAWREVGQYALSAARAYLGIARALGCDDEIAVDDEA